MTSPGVSREEGCELVHLRTGTAVYGEKKEGGVLEGEKMRSDFDDQMEIVIDLLLLHVKHIPQSQL